MKKQSLILAAFLTLGSVAVNGQETLTPPYTQDFYYSSDFNTMTIIDANNDGYKWSFSEWSFPGNYSNAARLSPNSANGADDWMITPALELKAGYNYRFSFKAAGANNSENNIDVMIGSAATAEALTTSVMDKVVLTAKVSNTYTADITVANDGVYYIGFHITAEAAQGYVYVDDIKIEAGLMGAAPAAVSALKATPTVENATAVMKLTFTAPDKTNSGDELTEITNIMVYRGIEKIADMGETAPGAELTYTDVAPAKGYNTYKVICVNNAGEGSEATTNASLYYSTPATPTNVVLSETEDGQTITWDAVTTGTTASYIFIPENVTYTVTRSDNVVIAEKIKECTVNDTYVKDGEGQNLIYYTVTANSEGGTSYATSNQILVGNPYTGEYAESFGYVNHKYVYDTDTWQAGSYWNLSNSKPYGSPAISADQDGSGAYIEFNTGSYAESRLVSPIINVSDLQNPRLSFYIYHSASCTYTTMIVPELLINEEYIALSEGVTVKGETDGWTKYSFILPKDKVTGDFQLSFKGVAGQYAYSAAIDNIKIDNALDYNLAATGITAPANLGVGETGEITVSIKNAGVNAATDYKVVLYCNNEEVASVEGEELASETTANIVFSYTATPFVAGTELEFSAEIVYVNDLNADDNTVSVTVPITTNDLPTPTGLKATDTANPFTIVLSWTAPEVPEVVEQPVMTESFEEWEVGSTEPFAGWKFVDGDGLNVYSGAGFSSSIPMAFMTTNSENVKALTGDNYLVSPQPYGYSDKRNDWAISPEVVGGQTISFSVYQYMGAGFSGTTFEVCYSSTDNNVECFSAIGNKIYDKSESWKEYTFTLPENAKYFAIHVFDDGSSKSYAMAIDDIKFQPGSTQLVHTGYNVYRDEKKIATIEDKAVTTFTDSDMADVDMLYSYAISALYETGESLTSDIVKMNNPVTGIEDIAGSQAVYANDGMLNVIGYAGKQLNVYNVSGQAVATKSITNDIETIALNNGVYIVTIADKTLKVVIK